MAEIMAQPNISSRVENAVGSKPLHSGVHCPDETAYFSISVIRVFSEFLGIDGADAPRLDEHIDPEAIDLIYQESDSETDSGSVVKFPYGDYIVIACSAGNILIFNPDQVNSFC